jgi:uncharacterized oligopeptide transporter (OPT) family protein
MDGAEVLIPILICLGFFAMIFGIVYMHKRENLAMVEKGMNPKLYRPAPYKNLKWGLLLLGSGVGLFLAYILHDHVLRVTDDNPSIYFSMLAIGGGLGLISSYRIEKKELLDKQSNNEA